MSYQPLARKYRPMQFSDLVGQDATAKALGAAISIGRQPPVTLFTGVRGVGKTTIARLYAKALNCDRGPTPTPCNECKSCLAIAIGNHEDVLEIDGASHTGVDDIRALRDTLAYVPQRSRFKVIIIDEVHMLSQSAFNALLKTTEEPPPHVVFIFATTELEKVPETIQSRCQIFFLKKIPTAVISARLTHVLTKETIPFEDRAVKMVAREGHGSMRDALTFLDRCIAQGNGKVDLETVSSLSSAISSTLYIDTLQALVGRDSKKLQSLVQKMYELGVEFIDASEALATFSRHAFIIREIGRDTTDIDILGLDDGDIERLAEVARLASPLDLNRIFRTFIKCRSDLSGSELDRFIFENYGLEWCLDPGLPFPQTANPQKETFANAGNKNANPQVNPVPTPKAAPASNAVSPSSVAAASTPPGPSVSFPASWGELIARWKQAKPLQGRQFEEAVSIEYSPSLISIAVNPKSLAGKTLLQKEQHAGFQRQLKEIFGFSGILKIEPRDSTPEAAAIESPLEVRQRGERERKDQIIQHAKGSPMVRDVIAVFNGKIENIEIIDPTH